MNTKINFINFNADVREKNELIVFVERMRKLFPSGAKVYLEVEKIYTDYAISFKLLAKRYVVERASVGGSLNTAMSELEHQLNDEVLNWRNFRVKNLKYFVKGGLDESA